MCNTEQSFGQQGKRTYHDNGSVALVHCLSSLNRSGASDVTLIEILTITIILIIKNFQRLIASLIVNLPSPSKI